MAAEKRGESFDTPLIPPEYGAPAYTPVPYDLALLDLDHCGRRRFININDPAILVAAKRETKAMKATKPLTRTAILRELQKHNDVLRKYSVKKIGLFGSYAFGRPHKNSDIDFLVEFEEPNFDNFMNLIEYLEELFRRKVEILTPQGVDSIRIKEVAETIRKSVVYV